MAKLIAAIDCGTSTVKAGIIDFTGRILGYSRTETPCLVQSQGRIEASPAAIRDFAMNSIREALRNSGIRPGDVGGISVTGQRASFVGLDETGEPLGNAISWQDPRGGDEVRSFEARMGGAEFRSITGLPLNPVFTIGKLMWLLRHDRDRAKGLWRIATIPDFLLWELGTDELVTDHANASLTGMFDLARRVWSESILASAEISPSLLPRPVSPGSRVGSLSKEAAKRSGLLAGTPLIAGAGDQQCAGIGAGALETGIVELALGTAAVPLMALDSPPSDPVPGLMYCCHAIPGRWEVEGFQNSAGSALEWGQRMLGSVPSSIRSDRGRKKAQKAQKLWLKTDKSGPSDTPVESRPNAHGVMFLPYLCGGSSAPHWNPDAKGMFLGLSLNHTPADLSRAILEGILIESSNVLELFASGGAVIREIRLTGGCSQNPIVPPMLAGITGLPVRVPENHEAGLLGAALLAAIGIEAFPSLHHATAAMVRLGKVFTASTADHEACAALRNRYRFIVGALEEKKIFSL